jgi:atlastin
MTNELTVLKNLNEDEAKDDLVAAAEGHAVQIVSIGSEENQYAFTYHEESLKSILAKIQPSTCKVAVVSVVGAFRTGKSFLLSWFLRYLAHSTTATTDAANTATSTTTPWYQSFESLGNDQGFQWRGGEERNTTGIWAWSEPFLLPCTTTTTQGETSTETVAVLLVDTQGMFDHETTMSLTAAIFGLSTLLSSYQIYNVDKRIQEDHLQQLALFSEYGRLAMQRQQQQQQDQEEPNSSTTKNNEQVQDQVEPKLVEENTVDSYTNTSNMKMKNLPPFQKIEFLVRDWQNFEAEEIGAEIFGEMDRYLQRVLQEREARDLKDTREQISSCFQSISCFLLSHPGFAVTKKKYTGDVKVVDDFFLQLLDTYCRRVFSPQSLRPKVIHGRELTAAELGAYIQAYASLFEHGANFPDTGTMLEATSSANNANAISLSVQKYKGEMDSIAGPSQVQYVKPAELEAEHTRLLQSSLALFQDMADFGSQRSIQLARAKVLNEIDGSFRLYEKLNESRNPLMGFEMYVIFLGFFLVNKPHGRSAQLLNYYFIVLFSSFAFLFVF